MIELAGADFGKAASLLRGCKQRVLPWAVVEGRNPGRVFVDQAEGSRLVLLSTRAGYFFLGGEPPGAEEERAIALVLLETLVPEARARGENGFILVPPVDWERHIPALLPGRRPERIFRRTFDFRAERFAALPPWRERIPAGLELRRVDERLSAQLGGMACWASSADFLREGIGFCVLDGETITSACYSVFASRAALELDLHTEERYRRRGLASLAASAFIEECLRQGRLPNWECFWENEASSSLAARLGFERIEDYPVIYWEEG